MSAASVPVGNQIESNSRTIAHSIPISRLQLQTVVELLDAVQEHAPHLPVSMLRTTATHLADCLKVPIERLKIADLVRVGPEFRQYLEERRFKRNSVRSYSNFLHILLQTAQNLGCQFNELDVPEPWKEIMGRLAKCHKGYTGPIQIAIRYGKGPSEFSEKDLSDWREEALRRGCCYGYVRSFAACFRLALLRLGLADRFPLLSCGRQRQDTHYRVPIDNFPATLRDEVQLLLRWKQDPYAEGRPRRGRHRAVTAKGLERCIARLYGFVTKVEKRTGITSLGQLIRKESVVAFVRWSLNERKVRSTGVAVSLGTLCAAMRWNPAYKNLDLSWFRPLLSQIPPESESEKRDRKARKYLPYDVVADLPLMIRRSREKATHAAPKKLAAAARDELLMSWVVALPWRQRNLRECRIGRNLFKAELSALDNVARPHWVQERLRANPHEEFWQFYFREEETKNGHEVRSILPRRLVPLLEDYLGQHRPQLLHGSDPGNLFLTRSGLPLTAQMVTELFSALTLRYKGRRVTPHIFRDIFAFRWLESHPEDYLTVSKALWHRDINTTLRIYGSRFDESHGVMRVEEWLDGRVEGPAHITQGAIESASKLRPRVTEGQTLDFKMEYEEQRRIAERLADRVEQLERQLSHETLEPHAERSQPNLRIQPAKVKSIFRKKSSGEAQIA